MKLDTQRARWQAVLDGYELINISGVRVKMIDGYLHAMGRMGVWDKTFIEFLNDSEDWQLYEPANEVVKPENKVVKIIYNPVYKIYTVGFPKLVQEEYVTENDAIRAAMEWIGEKASYVKITRPNWCAIAGRECGLPCGNAERLGLQEALLMRWPIEVIEEV